MNLKEIFKAFSDEMGPLIETLIRFNRYKTCVEIGVACGTTTSFICRGCSTHGGFVYGFDLWDTHGLKNQFPALSTIQEVDLHLKQQGVSNYKLTKINTLSEEFKNIINSIGEIDFAFIDGCHSYSGVKNDFDIVYPKLSKFGTILFHDTLRIDGCREFVIDLRTKYFDGSYDIIDFPWGNKDRRVGISMLTKRSFSACDVKIDEICGSPSSPEEIYNKENMWLKEQKCS